MGVLGDKEAIAKPLWLERSIGGKPESKHYDAVGRTDEEKTVIYNRVIISRKRKNKASHVFEILIALL